MTKEQEMMFEKEIYKAISVMKNADKNTQEDVQIYIDGIRCALRFMGYDYDFNGESVRLWKKWDCGNHNHIRYSRILGFLYWKGIWD